MGSLKSFIKSVRSAKTIADERTVIRKQSAAIRTSFRDLSLDQSTRRTNIAKLLFLYIIGEKTHFGQVECIKLIASAHFPDKRLGYLATMLLLDENQEVLTLLTNSLDNDMNHPSPFIVSLALVCLGNIASIELSRDLYQNVLKLIENSNPYVRKKACVVAAKLVDKNPELSEFFLPHLKTLLNDTVNSCLLGALRLTQSIFNNDPESRPQLILLIPTILSQLKRSLAVGYNPEYDVLGVRDPFLQCSLIETIRILCHEESSSIYLDQVNDILTQFCSHTEGGKNSAHSVLYECVKTIFQINSDQALKVLGVNILGKFLSTKDNNTRYVALNTLLSVITIEPLAVQRHRAIILACLGDSDISIKKRALELCFAILNEQNVRIVTREIISFLENCEDELKVYITTQLCIVCEAFAPNAKWHFDTLVKMLKIAGDFTKDEIVSHILSLIISCQDKELKRFTVLKLFQSSLKTSSYGLSLVAIWCIGEYPEFVLDQPVSTAPSSPTGSSPAPTELITEEKIISYIIGQTTKADLTTQQSKTLITHSQTSLLKLSTIASPKTYNEIRKILTQQQSSIETDISIRACEFLGILGLEKGVRLGVLEKMPGFTCSLTPTGAVSSAFSGKTISTKGTNAPKTASSINAITKNDKKDNALLDLLGDDVSGTKGGDLLADIFDSPSIKPSASVSPAPVTSSASILAGLSNPSVSSTPPPVLKGKIYEVYDSAQISVRASQVQAQAENQVSHSKIQLQITNKTNFAISNFQLLVAVPKTQKLTISSLSTNSIAAGQNINQGLSISGKAGSKIKLRVKCGFDLSNGEKVDTMFDFASFDEGL